MEDKIPEDKIPVIIAPEIVIPDESVRTEKPMSPTTTLEENRHALANEEANALRAEGQRSINKIWEATQAKIAIAVVYTVLLVATLISIIGMFPWATEKQLALAITAFMLLSSLSTLVIGFYYGRTNHQRSGGVGGNNAGPR